MQPERWFVRPRDPVVSRDGRSSAALDSGASALLPFPNTIAGMVRSSLVAGVIDPNPFTLLDVEVSEGPFLARFSEDGSVEPWLPAPADAIYEAGKSAASVHRALVTRLPTGVLAVGPAGHSLPMVISAPSRVGGAKTKPCGAVPGWRFWCLDDVVQWVTGGLIDTDGARRDPIEPETRIHVSIDDESGTADPGMLYATPGVRFSENFGIFLGVSVPESLQATPRPAFVQLGGEGRTSVRTSVSPSDCSELSFAAHEAAYLDALKRPDQSVPRGISLTLATPAWLCPDAEASVPGWLPSWAASEQYPGLPGLRLTPQAACLPRFLALSGWDMQWAGGNARSRGGPRAVRRFAPAGTVFYFETELDEQGLLDACRHLWMKPIEPREASSSPWPNREQHLAHPAHDGMGRMIPGFWWETKR